MITPPSATVESMRAAFLSSGFCVGQPTPNRLTKDGLNKALTQSLPPNDPARGQLEKLLRVYVSRLALSSLCTCYNLLARTPDQLHAMVLRTGTISTVRRARGWRRVPSSSRSNHLGRTRLDE